jgi:hypothetical protein
MTGALPVGIARGVGVTEIFDLWGALWHEAWAPWDGLWVFQTSSRPIDRALGVHVSDRDSRPVLVGARSALTRLVRASRGAQDAASAAGGT